MVVSVSGSELATWALVGLTALYVLVTFGLVRGTRRQLEAANMPYLALDLWRGMSGTVVEMRNPSALPCFDVLVVAVGYYEASKVRAGFYDGFPNKPASAEVTPDRDDWIGVYDVMWWFEGPARAGVRAAVEFPDDYPESAKVFVQYRSPLGINYGQLHSFHWEGVVPEGRYTLGSREPSTPKRSVRVEGVIRGWPPAILRRLFLSRIGGSFGQSRILGVPRWRRLPGFLRERQDPFVEFVIQHSYSSGWMVGHGYRSDDRGRWDVLTAGPGGERPGL
jgi:hypothetical protein